MSALILLLLAGSLAVVAQKAPLPSAEQLPAMAELPDPFLRPDGKRVQTTPEWERHRKTLLDLVLHYEYGVLPPVPKNVTANEVATRALETSGTERELLLTMGPKQAVQTRLFLSIPSGKGPFPVIIRGDLGWGRVAPDIVGAVTKRGYILAEFSRVEIAPDSAERGGVYAAYPDYDGGRLAAWAWGFHRVVDYLLTKKELIDPKRIAVTGHSRGGKAALLAGATDTRIALTAPNNSGCGGAGCYRYQGEKSEDIAAILKNFPFWFQPKFGEFIGKIDRLPFDQHTVKALVAPRALLSTEALGDLWANPSGTQQSTLAAKEVYDFLGAGNRIGITFREGKHEQNAEDWNTLLDFADTQFFGKSVSRGFDQHAFSNLPKVYSWRAPEK